MHCITTSDVQSVEHAAGIDCKFAVGVSLWLVKSQLIGYMRLSAVLVLGASSLRHRWTCKSGTKHKT